jgi:hypothetical protein
MNRKHSLVAFVITLAVALLLSVGSVIAQEQGPQSLQSAIGTAFTYQGQLKNASGPVNDNCDFQFSLWDAGNAGISLASDLSHTSVAVSQGLFTVQLDFGVNVFDGEARWLEIAVRCPAGTGSYVTLTPRQPLTPAPYALFSTSTGALQGRSITTTAPISGQVLKWMGTQWSPGDDAVGTPGSGDISAVNAGYGLLGGGTSGDVTLAVVTSTIQMRVNGSCPIGSSIRVVNQDGTVTCETDDNATYSAGTGLSLSGTQFSITPTYRLPQACGNNQIAKWNGSVWVCADDNVSSGNAWSLTGNAGTNPGVNFLGTTDNVSLTLAVSGTAALRLFPDPISPNVVGGYRGNTVAPSVYGAVIAGGGTNGGINSVSDNYATVGGGYNNTASNLYTTVGGGNANTASGVGAFVGGGGYDGINGLGNSAQAPASTIGGGVSNTVTSNAIYGTVGGGKTNTAAGNFYATVGGGGYNTASNDGATVGGGYGNTASNNYATVGGGQINTASNLYTTVGGGWWNSASSNYATVGGGYHNAASGIGAFVGGGGYDGINGPGNSARASASTISGGVSNTIASSALYGTIGGGTATLSAICMPQLVGAMPTSLAA